MQTQRMGSDPFQTFDTNADFKYEHHHLLPYNQFFTSDANAHADVSCEQGFPHQRE